MAGTLGGAGGAGEIDLQIIRKAARDQLIAALQSAPGPKDLVLDSELMRPLDRIAGASLLKENGVEKIYRLEPGKTLPGCEKRIYLVRSHCVTVNQIADQITAEQNEGVKRSYFIFLVPRKLHICSLILERAGVYGYVTVEEFPLDLIVLERDVLSLEMPYFFRSFFLDGDQTWCQVAARSIATIQNIFGPIPNVYGIGRCAEMVKDMLRIMTDSLVEPSHLKSDIGNLILIDRDVDFVTPFCSQVTYEGLLDDTFGIKSGYIEFGPEVTNREQSTKLLLNNDDPVFADIRNCHFSHVGNYLSTIAKQLQTGYDKRHNLSVGGMKDFVANDLRGLKNQHKSLSLHVSACEIVSKKKLANEFEDQLRTEHALLEGLDPRGSIEYIEEMINRQTNIHQCLRLMCLLSLTTGGLSSHVYKSLKTQFVHSYGFDQQLTLHNLKRVGLFMEAGVSSTAAKLGKAAAAAVNLALPSPFRTLSKRLNLIPKLAAEINLKNPNDISYVFSGAYTPLLCRLIEQVLVNEGFTGIEDLSRMIPVPTFADNKAKSVKGKSSATSQVPPSSRVVLVYFLGGCTYSEIAALRFLGKQRGYNFIVATTSILNSNSLTEYLAENVSYSMT